MKSSGIISVSIRAVLLLLVMQSTGAPAELKTLETTHREGSGSVAFRSGAGQVVDAANGINIGQLMYLAAGGQGETDYIEAEELIELFSPETTMTRSIRGIGGVTVGHSEARKEFRNILFAFASDRIEQSSYPQLREIGKALSVLMVEYPNYRFSIEGHTDSIGSKDYNLQLSQRRSQAVRDYLLEHFKLNGQRIRAFGLGETLPVASNDTALGRSLNRRVEVVRK